MLALSTSVREWCPPSAHPATLCPLPWPPSRGLPALIPGLFCICKPVPCMCLVRALLFTHLMPLWLPGLFLCFTNSSRISQTWKTVWNQCPSILGKHEARHSYVPPVPFAMLLILTALLFTVSSGLPESVTDLLTRSLQAGSSIPGVSVAGFRAVLELSRVFWEDRGDRQSVSFLCPGIIYRIHPVRFPCLPPPPGFLLIWVKL